MGRHHSSSSNKSQVKHWIREKEEFEGCTERRRDERPAIVVVDMMMCYKYWEAQADDPDSDRPPMQTYGDAVQAIANQIRLAEDIALNQVHLGREDPKDTAPLVVVMSFDNYNRTLEAREITHDNRKQGGPAVIVGPKPGEFQFPLLTDRMQWKLGDITASDHGYNARVLFAFLFSAITQCLQQRWMDRNTAYVFFGHHCTPEFFTLMPTSTQGIRIEGPPSKQPDSNDDNEATLSNLEEYPFLALYDANQRSWSFSILPALRNKIGEGDYVIFHLLEQFEALNWFGWPAPWQPPKPWSVCWMSNDSDVFCNMLAWRSRTTKDKLYRIETNTQQHLTAKEPPEWTRLTDCVFSKLTRTEMMDLAIVIQASGASDVMERYKGITPRSFLDAYWNNRDLLSPLFKIELTLILILDSIRYVRLLCLAYVQAKIKTALWAGFDPIEATYDTVSKKIIAHFKQKTDNWMPSKQDIMLSSQQLQYALRVLSKLGEPVVDCPLDALNIETYGYARDPNTGKLFRKIHNYTTEEALALIKEVCDKIPPAPKKRKPSTKKKPAKQQEQPIKLPRTVISMGRGVSRIEEDIDLSD